MQSGQWQRHAFSGRGGAVTGLLLALLLGLAGCDLALPSAPGTGAEEPAAVPPAPVEEPAPAPDPAAPDPAAPAPAAPATPAPAPVAPGGPVPDLDADPEWELTFFDGFDGDALDEDKWHRYSGVAGGGKISAYDPGNVTVEDGLLKLAIEERELNDRPFAGSGVGNGPEGFNQVYGKWEARVREPQGHGVFGWTAVWNADGTWLPEIDLVECPRKDEGIFTYHWRQDGEHVSDSVRTPVNCADGFHTYTMIWEPGKLTWFVDGVERGALTEGIEDGPRRWDIAIGALECDSNFGNGCPQDLGTKLPDVYEIDYVATWRAAG